MFPFSKKKKEEEEEEEIIEEDLPPKKKFRDLKPENKKKRKEPIKPWGKAERILVLSVLGATVFMSAILGAISRGGITIPNISFSIPDFSNPSFSLSQTFTFNKKTDENCCQEPIDSFKDMTNDLTGEYGFYVIRLDGSANYGFNEDDIFRAASLMKVPVVTAIYKEIEEGNLSLDDKYILKNSDKEDGNGSMSAYPEGKDFTYREIAKFALNQSDNTAFNILEHYLGDRKIQEYIKSFEMNNTSIYDDQTTARDMAQLFEKIKSGQIVNREHSDEILSFMKDTGFDKWMEAGVPEDLVIEHKYGREVGVVNDAGIVYSDFPYVLVITSKDVDELEADMIIPKISKMIYEFEISR